MNPSLDRTSDSEKLSKRDQGLTLRALKAERIAAAQIVGYLAHTLGLLDVAHAGTPSELLNVFSWDRIRRDDLIVPADATAVLRPL